AQGRCLSSPAGANRTTVICKYPTLNVGDTGAVTFTVLVDPAIPVGTQLSFDANASSDIADPNLSNNIQAIQFDSNAFADLSIIKTGLGPTPWVAGEERVIEYDVANKGPSRSRAVVVSDSLPAALGFVGAYLNVDGGAKLDSCTIAGGNSLV